MIGIPIAITEKKHKLLIFAGEDSMQTMLEEALIPEKFQLEFALEGSVCNLEAFNPKLILLDHSSAPLFNEENFCKKIKISFPNVPLIVLSAYPLNNLGSYNTHMDLFIAKPFDLNYFLNCIESYLNVG